ncbi:MAG: MGH1-like glycoside hydrolase domain-containing protein [Chloroflexota bacterium]
MDTAHSPRLEQSDVVTHLPHRSVMPCYQVADDTLDMGASLGNSALWVTTLGTGAIQQVFVTALGELLVNSMCIRYAGRGHRPQEQGVGPAEGMASSYVGLAQEERGSFDIHPAYQRHRFAIAGAVQVTETTFLPLGSGVAAPGDPPLVYQMVELRNENDVTTVLRVYGYARLRGSLDADVAARYDPELRALVAHNAGRPDAVRVFGVTATPSGYGASFDYDRVYTRLHLTPLNNSTEAKGDILGCLQVDFRLAPGESAKLAFMVALSGQGEAPALAAYRQGQDAEAALEGTLRHLEGALSCGQVLTPDPIINQGALWAKVNMRRVMARYPQGPAFTNEPGGSSNVVGRDIAWFVFGNDHFMPDFSRTLLDTFGRLQYPNGKIPEYYSALDGRVEDYGLNINDDTPLYILAVNHHYRATGNREWLRGIYPVVARAAQYIMSQIDARGLVYCSAQDPRGNVWAIAGWRNVIPQYSLNGAVTEVNAECAAALRAAGHLSQNLGLPDEQAQTFFAAGQRLREAMDRHLLNPANGLYYLNIDVDGNVHSDVTGDEVFPVMFRVCDEEVGFRIISRLNSPDFWTSAGLRTASRYDPLYDPFRFVGLIGGVWPGLTWWYAFAAARYHPEFMVEALRASFQHYAAAPKANNTVPGQFSEWFDGESLVNRGMRLSPWEPPRFMWAAVEGVCGLMLTPDQPRVSPLVPSAWNWVALRQLPYHGMLLTYFAARQEGEFHIYANADIATPHTTERFDEDVSGRVHAFSSTAAVVALRRPGCLLVLVGNVGSGTTVVPLDLQQVADPAGTYAMRIYNSERSAWEPTQRITGQVACSLAVSIEANGYRAVELTEVGRPSEDEEG